jgi:hypothetical protein
MFDVATMDICEKRSESEGTHQPFVLISEDTSSKGGHGHATRALLSPGGVHVAVHTA